MSGAVWGEVANAALQAGTAVLNYKSQSNANKTNVKLQRENQAWEEEMSNTAVQRRYKDILAAGGNPAAAFVNGADATTPTVTPARVEAPRFDAPRFNTAALLQKAQIDNMIANTQNTSADTRIKTTQARILEDYGGANSAAELRGKEQANSLFDAQMRKAVAEADISETTAKLVQQQKEAAIKLLQAQAEMGQLNLESSQAIAKLLGVAGKDLGPVARFFMELAKTFLVGPGRAK